MAQCWTTTSPWKTFPPYWNNAEPKGQQMHERRVQSPVKSYFCDAGICLTKKTRTLSEPKISGKTYDLRLLGRVMHYMRPYRPYFVLAVALTILIAGIAPALLMLIEHTLDK